MLPLLRRTILAVFVGLLILRRTILAVFVGLLSSACTMRLSQNMYSDPALQRGRAGVAVEGGLSLFDRTHALGRTDVQLTLANQQFRFQPRTHLVHVDLTARYFPFPFKHVHPYVAAGVGRYRFYTETVTSTCPPGYICFPGYGNDFEDRSQENLAAGLNPSWRVGVEVGTAGRALPATSYLLEVTRELAPQRSDWDFRSWRLGLGLTMRWF